MKYRPQRGGLAESLAEEVVLKPTLGALADHLGIRPEHIEVKPYCYDDRLNCDTFLVCVDKCAVGFTDCLPDL